MVITFNMKESDMKLAGIRISALTAFLFAFAMVGFGTTAAFAQDATPAAGAEPAHPVHIHTGSCGTLGDVVYPLNDITTYEVTKSFTFGPAATPEPGSMATPLPGMGMSATTPVLFSVTHIDGTLAELMDGNHAINAHESMENIQNYIACGNIPQCVAAACSGVSAVVVDLAPLNDSGYFGVAQISADPNGGSVVSVFLFHPTMP